MQQRTSRWLILTAAVLWSTSGLFAKSPWFADWPVVDAAGLPLRGPLLAFWRALFAALVLIPFVRRPRWDVKLIPLLLVYAIMNYTFLNALTMTTAANAIWLQHTAPAWVFLASVLVLRESFHPRDGWLLVFCLAGVGLIVICEAGGQSQIGVLFGLLSGLTYAGVVVLLRYLRDQDGAWMIMLNNLVTAMLFFPLVVRQGITPSGTQALCLFGFGALQMGIPYLLFARGLRHVAGHEAAGIVLLEPILVPVWVFVAWHHSPDYAAPRWWTLVGGVLILCGLMLRYAGRNKTD